MFVHGAHASGAQTNLAEPASRRHNLARRAPVRTPSKRALAAGGDRGAAHATAQSGPAVDPRAAPPCTELTADRVSSCRDGFQVCLHQLCRPPDEADQHFVGEGVARRPRMVRFQEERFAAVDVADATHDALAEQFFDAYPQLEGLRFTHRWGGVIDTSTRFAVGFGTALQGRAAYAVGYTGLGVGASRFGARVCLDLVDEPGGTPLTRMDFVRRKPIPFPPEPLRWVGITLTRRELARADRNGGRRGLWLRAFDATGLGFDS